LHLEDLRTRTKALRCSVNNKAESSFEGPQSAAKKIGSVLAVGHLLALGALSYSGESLASHNAVADATPGVQVASGASLASAVPASAVLIPRNAKGPPESQARRRQR
jgi:hypothetical protein